MWGEMTAPQPMPTPGAPREQRAVYAAVADLGRRALARSVLSDADREDVVARFLVAAYESWPTYRPALGPPGQWLLGVLYNTQRAFLRERARLADGDRIMAERSGTVQENSMSHAHEVLEGLRAVEQRIVWRYLVEEYTFDEIALFERMSKSAVERRYRAALKKLKAQGRVLALLAMVAATLPRRASAAELERLGRRLVAKHGAARGIVDASDFFRDWETDVPPDSGVRVAKSEDPQPPSTPRPRGVPARLRPRHVAGLLAGLLLAGSIADGALDRDDHERTASASTAVPVVAVPAPATASASSASAVVATESGPPAPQPAPNAGPADDRLDEALLDKARSALAGFHFDGALAACVEHEWRFRKGIHAADREQLWNQACAGRRASRPQTGTDQLDRRCAGRP
jgi:RNA polymerase sigma factor (sigma-70 family)